MRIAFSGDNGQISRHFGHSREFVIVEAAKGEVAVQKVIPAGSLRRNHQGLAELLAGEKVEAVVTGGIGPYALEALVNKGLKVFAGISGDIATAADLCSKGELVSSGEVCGCHQHHHGHGDCGHHHGNGCRCK